MRVEILHVPDCPHVAVLLARLADALTDPPAIARRTVTTIDEAEATGMRGSPTLLVDGADPFAPADAAPSLSCRLYRDHTGASEPAPTVTELRAALHDAMSR